MPFGGFFGGIFILFILLIGAGISAIGWALDNVAVILVGGIGVIFMGYQLSQLFDSVTDNWSKEKIYENHRYNFKVLFRVKNQIVSQRLIIGNENSWAQFYLKKTWQGRQYILFKAVRNQGALSEKKLKKKLYLDDPLVQELLIDKPIENLYETILIIGDYLLEKNIAFFKR